MFDIISIGDTTVDVFLEIDQAELSCDLNNEKCRICFHYGDKIPVKKVTSVIAVGNAANHAVGMSRLGFKTALYSIMGNDETGKAMYVQLEREGVETPYIHFDKMRGSNYSTVLNFDGERTILVFHEKRQYHLPRFAQTKWTYFTSMGTGSEVLHEPLLKWVKKENVRIAFNPGSFQLRLGLAKLEPLLKKTSVLFVNKLEAQRLLETEERNERKLLKSLLEIGVEVAVITDGANGSWCAFDSEMYYLPIFPAPVVERTGCGDAYATGFMAALLRGHSIPQAMCWGNANATSVLQYIGAQEGLLKKSGMQKMLRKYRPCKTQLI